MYQVEYKDCIDRLPYITKSTAKFYQVFILTCIVSNDVKQIKELLNGYGYEVLKIKDDEDTGYYGAIFKIEDRCIIHSRISNFGFNPDLLEVFRLVYLFNPSQITPAKELVEFAISECGKENLEIQGTSLGGVVSQFNYLKYDIPTYVLDTIGIQNYIDISSIKDIKTEYKSNLEIYLFPPNGVNSLLKFSLVGNVTIFKIDCQELLYKIAEPFTDITPNIRGAVVLSNKQHSMDTIATLSEDFQQCSLEKVEDIYSLPQSHTQYLCWHTSDENAVWRYITEYQNPNLSEEQRLAKYSNFVLNNLNTCSLNKNLLLGLAITSNIDPIGSPLIAGSVMISIIFWGIMLCKLYSCLRCCKSAFKYGCAYMAENGILHKYIEEENEEVIGEIEAYIEDEL